MSALPTLSQHRGKVVSKSIRQGKEIKDTQIRKEELKLLLFLDEVIAYHVENSKNL